MEISNYLLEKIIINASELGAINALVKAGKLKPYLKKSEALLLFGRVTVEQWLHSGFVTPRKDGDHSAAWRLDRLELEIIRRSSMLFQELEID